MVRLLFACVFGVLAVFAQVLALRTLCLPAGSLDPVLVFFLWQMLAAFMTTLFVLTLLPSHYRDRRVGAFFHIFAISLFLPVAGPLLFLGVMVAAIVFSPVDKQADSSLVEAPRFVTYLVSRVTHGSAARLRARLENRSGSADDRVAAMVAVRALPPHITGGMLRDLLSDHTEEIRLLAYGVVDGAEKPIRRQIFVARERLPRAATIAEQADISARLAELHWELIYQDLVHGEVYNHTLKRVEHYAHEAIAQNAELASMWYLLGRCALLCDRPDDAEGYFQRALLFQFPADRVSPWLAEAAFLQHNYSRLGEMLSPLDNGALSPMLQPTVRYWSK